MQGQYGATPVGAQFQFSVPGVSPSIGIFAQLGATITHTGTGEFTLQFPSGVNKFVTAVTITQYNQAPQRVDITYNPTTNGFVTAAMQPFTLLLTFGGLASGGGDPADPSTSALINVVCLSCFDGESGEVFP